MIYALFHMHIDDTFRVYIEQLSSFFQKAKPVEKICLLKTYLLIFFTLSPICKEGDIDIFKGTM